MSRETLVLLPGMMCDARLFGPQIERFGSDYDVVVGDLRGADSIAGLADAVLRDITAPRFNLAGLSMGGIVAMAVMGRAPERVARVALLDTNHRADPTERRPIRNRQIEAVRNGGLRDVIVEEMKPNYLAAGNRGNQALLNLLVEMALDVGADAFETQSVALRDRPDQSMVLTSWSKPALILCGAEDALCSPDRHREIAGLMRDATLVIVPEAGHISTLERPEDVNDALGALLARA